MHDVQETTKTTIYISLSYQKACPEYFLISEHNVKKLDLYTYSPRFYGQV